MSDYPPIPTLIRGTRGAIRVRRVKRARGEEGDACWGLWDDAKRIITLDKTAKPEHQWGTLFHEWAHAAICDAGLHYLMTEEGIDSICDCIATARMQELRGQLGIMDA